MDNKQFILLYKKLIDEAKTINLDITYKCPLQCPFCFRQRTPAKKIIKQSTDIELSEFEKIINHCDDISLCGQISDPIYHDNFIGILKIINKNPNKHFQIHTNGTRKKTNWWKQAFALTGSNVRWTFGLDGTDQETANIYRVNTRYDEVMEIMKLGVSMNCTINWLFIVFRHNEHQIELAKQIAKENKINLNILESDRWPQHLMDKYQIYPPSYRTSKDIKNRTQTKIINIIRR